MRNDEANESLREDADADFDAAGGDDTSSPVLRRGPSTGCLGMGDCCEDEKLVRDCDGLVAWLDEVDGGGGDRSLKEELGEKEEEKGDREFDEVQGVNESANVGLEKSRVDRCESEQASERVGGSTDISGGIDIGDDCAGSVSGEQEVLGVVEGSGRYEDSDAEAQTTLKMVDASAVVNCGAIDQTSAVEVVDNGLHSDSENGAKLVVVQEIDEKSQDVLRVEEENVHVGSEQPVEVDCCQLQPTCANDDVADQSLAVDIVENGSGLGDLILGKKDDEEECPQSLGSEEENELLGLIQKIDMVAPEMAREEEHKKLSDSSASSMLAGDCFGSSSCQKVGVPKNLNTHDSHQPLEVEITNTMVSVNCGSGTGESTSVIKEAEDENSETLGIEQVIKHLDLKQAPSFEGVRKSVIEEEHDEFPGLSPLRTLGRADFGCSVFGIGSEVGFLSSGALGNDGVSHGCEDAKLFVSSGLAASCSLLEINRDASKTAERHHCPQGASQNCQLTCINERCEKSHCFGVEKVNAGHCSGKELLPNNGNGEELRFSMGHSVPSQYVGLEQEHCGDNIDGSHSICPQEIAGGREVNHSVQVLPVEDAPCTAAPGSALGEPPYLSTPIESFSSKLYLSPDFQGGMVDASVGTSVCCSNVNSYCGKADNGGRSDSKYTSPIVLRRSNPKRSASLRSNLADENYCQSSKTINSRRSRRKTVNIGLDFLLSKIKFSELKRKRSWPRRPARHSIWGPLENLIRNFDQNVNLANCDADKVQIQNKRSRKGRSTVGSKTQSKFQKDGKFLLPAAKHSATSDHHVFHDVVGLPTSNCQLDFDKFTKVEDENELGRDKLDVVKSLKQDEQLGEKDRDSSLTQEASGELGERSGVSSQIASEMLVETVSYKNSLDPGTSPDSDVYNPVIDVGMMTSEGNNSADQVIGNKDVGIITSEGAASTEQMGQNVLVQGAVSDDGLHPAVSTSSNACVTSFSVPFLDPNLCAKAKNGKMKGQVREQSCLSDHLSALEKSHEPEILNNTKKPTKPSKSKQKKQDFSNKKNRSCSRSHKKTNKKGSKCKSVARKSSVPETAELQRPEESMEAPNCLDNWVFPGEEASNLLPEASLHTFKTEGHKLSGGTKPSVNKGISYRRKTAGQKRETTERKKGNSVQKSDNKCNFSTEDRSQTVDASVEVSNNVSFSSGIVDATLTGSTQKNGGTNVGSRAVPQDITSLVMTAAGDPLISNEPESILEQMLPPQVAWVLCDDCEKWRCISVELANTLEETKGKWTCKDNTDKAFADCSIPQEKTNSEINAELGISDEEDPSSVKANANEVEPSKLADVATSGRASWTPIKSNMFLHRTRKTQTIDEIMVCHCKPMRDGHQGCGDQCLNRMLNIECVKGTCPCGDLCSNQRFQKRKYAKFKWFRCGKKGYGLQLREDASQGQFLIEYVGEVLDLSTYEARQKDYASRGQKHFYFMTLNGGEVIDACAKGNLGRFINHSCEPNCRTEKWMVNGEVCIGLFAIRDIRKGEEVTFDYNYVRVDGAAAKKCVCGSSECRGYIGGDPLNSEVIVQGDSDEEDFEPVIIRKNSQRVVNLNDSLSNASDMKAAKHKGISVEREDIVVTCSPAVPEPQTGVLNEEDVCSSIPEVNPVNISLQSLDPMQLDSTISTPISGIQSLGDSKLSSNSTQVEERVRKSLTDIQPQEISLHASSTVNEVPSNSVLNSKKSTTNLFEEKPNTTKPNSLKKSSHSRGTIKRGRSNMKHPVSDKTKTSTIGAGSSHFQGVEEKLNELLDVDGGISKQKDATRGYLKLLFVTAAGGDVRGCASQSTRDLSLILDAVLKTKSRKVLVDIINKNGLQMLHNIMKQNRGNFTRIPIIRKLLKVFEFLALAGILTLELINKPPPCTGMESFKESILKLANHEDKLVHKIAREFRDKWIPRHIRRVEPSDRDDSKLDRQVPYHPWIQSPKLKRQQVSVERDTDAIVISAPDPSPASSNKVDTHGEASSYSQQLSINVPLSDNSSASGTKVRKRKSRWDTPSDVTSTGPQYLETSSKFMKCALALSEQTSSLEVSRHKYGAERGENRTSCEVGSSQDLMQLDDERPPGFAGFANDEGPPGFLNNDEGPPGFLDDGPPGFLDEGPPGFVDGEGPPGFEPHQKNHHSPFSSETALITGEVFTGHPQEIYLSQMTVSFGMPVALMQQLGTPETGGSQSNQNWAVAPGMPFYPYPPLPSYPMGQPNPRQKRRHVHQTSDTIPSTSGEAPDMTETGFRNSQFNGRLRWPNKGYGRKFPRQQRWNDNPRFQRFGPHQKFGRGFRGNMRNGPHSLEVGNVRSELRGGLRPPDSFNNNGGFCSNFHKPHNY